MTEAEIAAVAGRDEWTPATIAPPDPGVYLAVRDSTLACDWHFAEFDRGQWWDVSSGARIKPTHWMPLPAHPTAHLQGQATTPNDSPAKGGDEGRER